MLEWMKYANVVRFRSSVSENRNYFNEMYNSCPGSLVFMMKGFVFPVDYFKKSEMGKILIPR